MDTPFIYFVIFGFIAQMIDGMLGMGYGVSATTMLLMLGLPPQLAIGNLKLAETCTTGISAFSHFKLKNVKNKIFWQLVVPGMIGAITGAYILGSMAEKYGKMIKPYIYIGLLLMGIRIIWKAFNKAKVMAENEEHKHLSVLGFIGGLVDAACGGGWGPIATTSLVINGEHPRYAIGSVNTAEFFLTAAQVATLSFFTVFHWQIFGGLLLGGALAAFPAAKLTGKVPAKPLKFAVGALIIILSFVQINKAFHLF